MNEPTDTQSTDPQPPDGTAVSPRSLAAANDVVRNAMERVIPQLAAVAVDAEAMAGILFDPKLAEQIATAARDQAAAEYRAELEELRGRLAELEAGAHTLWRAEHHTIPIELYTNPRAAREHCESLMRRDEPDAELRWHTWEPSTDDDPQPEELVCTVGGRERLSDYVIVPLTALPEYDPTAGDDE
ncbi:hypothetical protein ABVG11_34415 [Streptomyces sp. HD1123-B1]|uniref:hypothetical protein n=1 Tax=Streptomyces huangiella TaxID=3228804 RepID=UPI003D7EBC47